MKNLVLLLFTAAIFCSSCNNDDDTDDFVTSQEFTLEESNSSGISGTITFDKFSSGRVFFSIALDGTEVNKPYFAYLYNNSVSENSDIAISVGTVNGEFGTGVHIVSHLDQQDPNTPATAITYEELIQFDGHIKINTNDDESIVVAEGNIGSNVQ